MKQIPFLPSLSPPLRPPRRCTHTVFSHIFRQAAAAVIGEEKKYWTEVFHGICCHCCRIFFLLLLPPPFLTQKTSDFFGSGQIISNMLPIQNRKPFFSLFTIEVFLKPQSRSQQTRDMGCTYGQLLPLSQLFSRFFKNFLIDLPIEHLIYFSLSLLDA